MDNVVSTARGLDKLIHDYEARIRKGNKLINNCSPNDYQRYVDLRNKLLNSLKLFYAIKYNFF